jgi:hypothetical protein
MIKYGQGMPAAPQVEGNLKLQYYRGSVLVGRQLSS